MPRIDVAIPPIRTGRCHSGSPGLGQAIAPRKKTLTMEMRYPRPFQSMPPFAIVPVAWLMAEEQPSLGECFVFQTQQGEFETWLTANHKTRSRSSSRITG